MQADTAPALQLQTEVNEEALDLQQVAYRDAQPFITPAMQAFAEHWAYNRNQIKAYQHAFPGSSVNAAKTHARRLFADGRVQAEILRVLDRWTDLSAAKLLRIEQELARLAFADPRMLFDASGHVLDPHDWDADTAAAVSSFKEVVAIKGRGEDKYTEVTRTVRLHDKHAAARTLAEIKGAFDKKKAPPGAAAIFNINIGGGNKALGAAQELGRTITVDMTKPGRTPKALKQPKPATVAAVARSHAHRTKVKRASAHVTASKSVDISTVEPLDVMQVTPAGKRDLF